MSLVIFICMTILLIMSFYFLPKTMNILQNTHVLMLAIFLFTCYCSVIYVNLEFWKLSNHVPNYILFRIYQLIVIPILVVWFCNGNNKKTKKYFLIRTVCFTLAMFLLERLLIGWNVITYVKWNGFISFLAFLLLLLVIFILNHWFTVVLRKEGIRVE
jgi:hypothetical protein